MTEYYCCVPNIRSNLHLVNIGVLIEKVKNLLYWVIRFFGHLVFYLLGPSVFFIWLSSFGLMSLSQLENKRVRIKIPDD